jgi:hypothetical protein
MQPSIVSPSGKAATSSAQNAGLTHCFWENISVWSFQYGEFGFSDCEYVRIDRSSGQPSVNWVTMTKLDPCGTLR